jgi:hypothetical protein
LGHLALPLCRPYPNQLTKNIQPYSFTPKLTHRSYRSRLGILPCNISSISEHYAKIGYYITVSCQNVTPVFHCRPAARRSGLDTTNRRAHLRKTHNFYDKTYGLDLEHVTIECSQCLKALCAHVLGNSRLDERMSRRRTPFLHVL